MQQLWRQIDPAAIGRSWAALSPRAVDTLSFGQLLAAAGAASYVAAQSTAQGADVGDLPNPTAFAGTTADGVALETAMGSLVASAGQAITAGAPPREALFSTGLQLSRLVANEVQQAGNNATHIGITSQPG
ncbi:MAG: hypothetical protein ABFE07_25305, partial [Armatimonadia bacterium]